MSISATIILDSVNESGNRLISYILTYPRLIHCEVMTHRAFSRNAASSRAIPITKSIDTVLANPALPVEWGENCKGMQAGNLINNDKAELCEKIWLEARDKAVESARKLNELKVHKQLVNRLLEPFAHMTTLLTATEFGNFFNLRADPDAQPEFQELAYLMLTEYEKSEPVKIQNGQWHVPFADKFADGLSLEDKLKISVARAARISYKTFDGEYSHEKDFALHDSLLQSGHMSPFEHQALAGSVFSCNFKGWTQYRKFIANENREQFNASDLYAKRNKKRGE